MKYYTGVGSRSTPPEILEVMTKLARTLNKLDHVLRTGDAKGADSAFLLGTNAYECFKAQDIVSDKASQKALELAESIHPAWERCNDYVRKLHARNCFQVLGRNLDTPSRFLICWTPNAKNIGGTRTAILLAYQNDIPVFNLANKNHRERIQQFIKSSKTTDQ